MTTGLLTTTLGQAAIAADLAGGADLALTHVAFGDAGGVPYVPNPAQTALVNEKYRATISSVAVVDGAIVIDSILPADTPDGSGRPSHGFSVAEAGIFNSAGTLIAVARMNNGYKPAPGSGQASIATFRFKLAVSNPSAITVVIDPQAQVSVGRHVRQFWLTVDGVLNAPPGAPALGATYIIGAAPTGAWTGFANRVAQWVGVWALATPPTGHLVADSSKALNDPLRHLRRAGDGTWAAASSSSTAFGWARRVTAAQALDIYHNEGFLTPEDLEAALRYRAASGISQPIFPEVTTSDGRLNITTAAVSPSAIVEIATGTVFVHRGGAPFSTSDFSQAERQLTLAANKTWHVRWHAPGKGDAVPASTYPKGRFVAKDCSDTGYCPGGVGSEGQAALDTTFDDMLIAKIVTGAAGASPSYTQLSNKARLSATLVKSTIEKQLSTWTGLPSLAPTLNWSRRPQLSRGNEDYDVTASNESMARYTITGVSRYTFAAFGAGYAGSDYISGAITIEASA